MSSATREQERKEGLKDQKEGNGNFDIVFALSAVTKFYIRNDSS
jgi:hypothetical protein